MLKILLLNLAVVFAQENFNQYENCPVTNPSHLTVHLFCHSHMDVGWVKTEDQYFEQDVTHIYSSVIDNLKQNRSRKFIISEIAFMSRWYNNQSSQTKNAVKEMVRTGQIEFVGGGWVQNDEAVTHYSAIIDQLSFGIKWIVETFGIDAKPKAGWQIDPFGHSRGQAYIYDHMNYEAIFLGRIDYQDKLRRIQQKKMEVLWKTSSESNRELFTVVLPNVYWPPNDICYDFLCFQEYRNVDALANIILKNAETQALQYKSKHIIMTMGNDFYYREAGYWYQNLDLLIEYFNTVKQSSNISLVYSTPGCYLKSLHSSNIKWPKMSSEEDFLPYSSNLYNFWSGYYTSRPALKYFSRIANGFLQASKQIAVLAGFTSEKYEKLKRAVAVMQHHDAITGTETEEVKNDYVHSLTAGIFQCQALITDALKKLNPSAQGQLQLSYCPQLNISECRSITSQSQKFKVILYNPLTVSSRNYLKLPIPKSFHKIKCFNWHKSQIPCEIVPIPNIIQKLSWRNDESIEEVVFKAYIPPLSFISYQFEKLIEDSNTTSPDSNVIDQPISLTHSIQNEFFEVMLAFETGLVKEIRLKNGPTVPLTQSFYQYRPQNYLSYHEESSGAYLFTPGSAQPVPIEDEVTFRILKGDLVEEIHQTFNPWLSQVIRLYKGIKHVEFDWVVGPLASYPYYGEEIVMKFNSNLNTKGTFYTDVNGKEEMKRVLNERPGWNWNATRKVSGNYYPITSWISVKDKDRNLDMTILNDRAQGGSSLSNGSIELMIHRRLYHDDRLGVNEALNEPGEDGNGLVIQGKHYLFLGSIASTSKLVKKTAIEKFHSPIVIVNNGTADININFSNGSLNAKLHVLTMEPLNETALLVRVENFLNVKENENAVANFSLKDLLPTFVITSVFETELSGIQLLPLCKDFGWRNENNTATSTEGIRSCTAFGNFNINDIEVKPNSIRTFIVNHRV